MSLQDALTKDFEPLCASEKIEKWARKEFKGWLEVLSNASIIESDLLVLKPVRTLITTACVDIEQAEETFKTGGGYSKEYKNMKTDETLNLKHEREVLDGVVVDWEEQEQEVRPEVALLSQLYAYDSATLNKELDQLVKELKSIDNL